MWAGIPLSILFIQDALPWSLPVRLARRTWGPEARARVWERLPGAGAGCGQRWEELAARYPLERLSCCGDVEFVESLYALDLLNRHAREAPPGPGLDVGAKYGAMLPGQAAFRPGWTAVERLGHARYLDTRTRRAWGEAFAAALPECRYVAGDVREIGGDGEQFAVITWFLPFLFGDPAEAWGFPLPLLQPEATLRHVLGLLQPGGVLLVVNQGAAEQAEQGRLLREVGAAAEPVDVTSCFSPYRRPRMGWKICKKLAYP